MAGMEVLGRLANVIPAAAGNAFKMRGASSAMIVCNGYDQYTVKESSSFGGSYAAVAVIKNVYTTTAANGTTSWSKYTNNTPLSTITLNATAGSTVPANAFGANAVVAVFHVFTSQLTDPNDYIEIVAAASGLVTVVLSDLVVQRGPANLEILGV